MTWFKVISIKKKEKGKICYKIQGKILYGCFVVRESNMHDDVVFETKGNTWPNPILVSSTIAFIGCFHRTVKRY